MSSDSETELLSYPNEEYTVGWICALEDEMAAAEGMMDEKHGDPQAPPRPADRNTYLLGSIGKFKVVIACLPMDEPGSSSATAAAREMMFTFPKIRVGLLVGIGAGIPYYGSNGTQDIRLGDVVIGSEKGSSGVVVYDFGKKLGDGSFESRYALDLAPRSLRTALSTMAAKHKLRDNKICKYIDRMLAKHPKMKRTGFAKYPGQSADQLFEADDPAKAVDRENRDYTIPEIHYGVIASGNAVIKHAPTRELIREEHQAICLEMEAAGLMNNFPCLVIRGISDYADSHKNDQWRSYAAATAAACAKELLQFVQPRDLDGERPAKDIMMVSCLAPNMQHPDSLINIFTNCRRKSVTVYAESRQTYTTSIPKSTHK